eukprot:CAMPEP_0118666492 /NCGR_PEP_ID=MMETSP0785-20121206/19245_1 /TAXON_ID=91992 /ORGANISM="Bolidomonas pacifica, Strain CCMP 1866" /LENGTH=358 /DNA_ID=CAMNT_0006560809 /DNA_START=150 /DNA_END=1226 /DNA_ORIENTATION=+
MSSNNGEINNDGHNDGYNVGYNSDDDEAIQLAQLQMDMNDFDNHHDNLNNNVNANGAKDVITHGSPPLLPNPPVTNPPNINPRLIPLVESTGSLQGLDNGGLDNGLDKGLGKGLSKGLNNDTGTPEMAQKQTIAALPPSPSVTRDSFVATFLSPGMPDSAALEEIWERNTIEGKVGGVEDAVDEALKFIGAGDEDGDEDAVVERVDTPQVEDIINSVNSTSPLPSTPPLNPNHSKIATKLLASIKSSNPTFTPPPHPILPSHYLRIPPTHAVLYNSKYRLISDLSTTVKSLHLRTPPCTPYNQFTVVLNRHVPSSPTSPSSDVGLGLTVLCVDGMIRVHALTRPRDEGEEAKGPAEIN